MNRMIVLSAVALITVSSMTSANGQNRPGQKKWAIVIGVNNYNLAPDLKFGVNDSFAISQILKSLRFHQIILLNDFQDKAGVHPTRDNIRNAMERVAEEAKPSDLVVFFFSGHGVGVDGRSWICPMEANLESPGTTMISVDEIVGKMLECKASQRVLLFDACRNATHDSDARGVGVREISVWKRANAKFVSKISPPRNQELALLASCDVDQESYENDELKHGLFTHSLIEQLSGRSTDDQGFVEFSRVCTAVRDRVTDLARIKFAANQTPVQSGYHGNIQLGKYTTLIDESFEKVEIGGLPDGNWKSDPDLLVDLDIKKKKLLCATGNGGWLFTNGISVTGEFELRYSGVFNSRNHNRAWIAFDKEGERTVPGIVLTFDYRRNVLKATIGWIDGPHNSSRRQRGDWASKQFELKPVGTNQQIELEITVRRQLVRRGNDYQARYQVILNGDEDDLLTVSGQPSMSFDQLGFFIEADGGNDRIRGIRRIQLLPVIR